MKRHPQTGSSHPSTTVSPLHRLAEACPSRPRWRRHGRWPALQPLQVMWPLPANVHHSFQPAHERQEAMMTRWRALRDEQSIAPSAPPVRAGSSQGPGPMKWMNAYCIPRPCAADLRPALFRASGRRRDLQEQAPAYRCHRWPIGRGSSPTLHSDRCFIYQTCRRCLDRQ